MANHGTNAPLIPNLPNINVDQASHPTKPSPLTSAAVATLAISKIALGVSCVIAPRFACSLFLLRLSPQAAITGRLFGSSCAALGALTWSLHRKVSEGTIAKAELKTAVTMNLIADTVDTMSCVIGYSSGMYGLPTLGMLGGGCAVLAVLGAVGYHGIVVERKP